jgi:hypothetical protein
MSSAVFNVEQKSDKSQTQADFHNADYYFNLVSYQSTPITRTVTVQGVSGTHAVCNFNL